MLRASSKAVFFSRVPRGRERTDSRSSAKADSTLRPGRYPKVRRSAENSIKVHHETRTGEEVCPCRVEERTRLLEKGSSFKPSVVAEGGYKLDTRVLRRRRIGIIESQ